MQGHRGLRHAAVGLAALLVVTACGAEPAPEPSSSAPAAAPTVASVSPVAASVVASPTGAAAASPTSAATASGAAAPTAAAPTATPTKVRLDIPVPGPDEIYLFGPDVTAQHRRLIQEWTAYGVHLQEVMFGRRITSFTTIASGDVRWIAEQDCRNRPAGMPNCVQQQMDIYADALMGGCFPAPEEVECFDIASLAPLRWDEVANNAKTFAHEVHHVFQQQVVPDFWESTMVAYDAVRSTGPIWLWEGAAEWVGWKIAIDTGYTTYAAKRADWEEAAREIDRPLSHFETLAASDASVGGPGLAYQYYAFALDELLDRAPHGTGSLLDFYEAIGAGTAWKTAFERAFGMSVAEFYAVIERIRP